MDEGEDFRWWGDTACQRADFEGTDKARGGQATICAGAGGVRSPALGEVDARLVGGSCTGGTMGLDGMRQGRLHRAARLRLRRLQAEAVRRCAAAAAPRSRTTRPSGRSVFQALLPPELGGAAAQQGVDRKAESGTGRGDDGLVERDSRQPASSRVHDRGTVRHPARAHQPRQRSSRAARSRSRSRRRTRSSSSRRPMPRCTCSAAPAPTGRSPTSLSPASSRPAGRPRPGGLRRPAEQRLHRPGHQHPGQHLQHAAGMTFVTLRAGDVHLRVQARARAAAADGGFPHPIQVSSSHASVARHLR